MYQRLASRQNVFIAVEMDVGTFYAVAAERLGRRIDDASHQCGVVRVGRIEADDFNTRAGSQSVRDAALRRRVYEIVCDVDAPEDDRPVPEAYVADDRADERAPNEPLSERFSNRNL